MTKCHGCDGRGWVDSQAAGGPTICPICNGSGDKPLMKDVVLSQSRHEYSPLARKSEGGRTGVYPAQHNKNPLLSQLEHWLLTHDGVQLHTPRSSMNGYYSRRFAGAGDFRGLVWVSTRGDDRIYLRKGDYSKVDNQMKVRGPEATGDDTWGGYPQCVVQRAEDVEYAKRLIDHAYRSL